MALVGDAVPTNTTTVLCTNISICVFVYAYILALRLATGGRS